MRAIVSVATGRFVEHQDRLQRQLNAVESTELRCFWRDQLPPASPAHEDVPYAFKAYALLQASLGANVLLWMDSSIYPIRSLEPLWDFIENHGFWFSENLPQGRSDLPAYNCGQWCCDSALPALGITREDAFGIPQVIATSFGLDLRLKESSVLLEHFVQSAAMRTAFQGPWSNGNGEASPDPRVLGHRHDQTVLSVLAHRMWMPLTRPPTFIVDEIPATEDTVMEIWR
jgi:hypothetical protein